uniref:Uncharacterized protein n=2 Tax=Canis lupus familiaris TaxID=9615 RepID=A0A8I3NCA3_CANLF
MAQGAVRVSPPAAQRVPRQASGEWAIRTIGQSRKEPNYPKRLGGTPNCLPILLDAHPTQCYILPLVGWVLQGRLLTLLCVPQQAALPGSSAILTRPGGGCWGSTRSESFWKL